MNISGVNHPNSSMILSLSGSISISNENTSVTKREELTKNTKKIENFNILSALDILSINLTYHSNYIIFILFEISLV